MTDNILLIEAIGNPNLPKILTEIRKLSILDRRDDGENQRLETLLFRARSFARAAGADYSLAEILETVKNATGDELDIILGDYRGEIPVVE